jgi:allophanate hydrolase subunit 1
MTAVEILFRYTTPPTERASLALAGVKDVYGIRRLSFDHAARTLLVEYDATRLDATAVAKLLRQAGLEIAAESPVGVPEIAPVAPHPPPQPEPRS